MCVQIWHCNANSRGDAVNSPWTESSEGYNIVYVLWKGPEPSEGYNVVYALWNRFENALELVPSAFNNFGEQH